MAEGWKTVAGAPATNRLSECPHCQERLRFNPSIVDGRQPNQ